MRTRNQADGKTGEANKRGMASRTVGLKRGMQTVEGCNRKSAGRLIGFMNLNNIVTVIMDVISRFKSLWTGMTHLDKFMDRMCTLLYLSYLI